jgi:CRISPR/Cas system CSM-associated protein Csm3 (group 7 of RAMP superfamily)
MLTNQTILQRLIEQAGVENPSQYAAYLSEKYGVAIDRRQIHQFEASQTLNLIHILLREALEE